MKSPFTSAAIMGLAFLSFTAIADARRGLDADELHLLTRGTDYTFHSICADFKNPDLFFDEWVFASLFLLSYALTFCFIPFFFCCNLLSLLDSSFFGFMLVHDLEFLRVVLG